MNEGRCWNDGDDAEDVVGTAAMARRRREMTTVVQAPVLQIYGREIS
jgi:hypothetical protein